MSTVIPPLWSRPALILGIIGALAAAGCNRGDPVVDRAAPAVPVEVAVAQRQDVPRRIDAIGTVQPLRSVAVKSQVDGIIGQIHFQEGQDVAAGERLVTLDRRPLENSLRSARADLAMARAQAEQAKADLDRYQRLDEKSAISKEEYVQYVTRAATTEAQSQAREAAVANAELLLGYTEIRAPIAGRTGQRLLHEGALVKANDNNFTLVTINQLAPIAVSYAVPEGSLDDIRAALAEGRATVSVQERQTALTRDNGRLEFVDNTVDPTTGMVTLKAVFPNEDRALWPGRFVAVVTQIGVDRGVVVVPSTAVQNSQTGATVYVVGPDQTVELRKVEVLRTAGDNTLIRSGVSADEVVVTDGQLRLLPGLKADAHPAGASAAPPAAGPAAPDGPAKS